MQCPKQQKLNLNLLQTLICTYSWKKVQEVEFLVSLTNAAKPTINLWNRMTQNPKQESKKIIYFDVNNLYGYAMSKFRPTSGFKWIDPEDFDLNKYTSSSSKGCVLEVHLEYRKKLRELHNDYLLAPDKIETKREILSEHQLKNADLYNTPIGNVKKIVPIFFC